MAALIGTIIFGSTANYAYNCLTVISISKQPDKLIRTLCKHYHEHQIFWERDCQTNPMHPIYSRGSQPRYLFSWIHPRVLPWLELVLRQYHRTELLSEILYPSIPQRMEGWVASQPPPSGSRWYFGPYEEVVGPWWITNFLGEYEVKCSESIKQARRTQASKFCKALDKLITFILRVQ